MLKGEVFSRQLFENQIFALFINTFLNGRNGVSNNYLNGMTITYAGSNVTVSSGAVCIQGRFLTEDTSSTLSAGTESAYCKLVIEINLDNVNTENNFTQGSYKIVRGTTGYPTLTQTDIVKNNSGIYQYELARFRVTNNGIIDFQDMRTFLDFDSIYDEIEEHIQDIDNGTLWLPKTGGTMTGELIANAGIRGNLTGNITGNVSGSSGSCSGNSATATKLQSSKTINGTSFDGSSNITTAKWGNSRNLSFTGGITGSSNVDGSENINISTKLNIAKVTGTINIESGGASVARLNFPSGYNSSNCIPICIGAVTSGGSRLHYYGDLNNNMVFDVSLSDAIIVAINAINSTPTFTGDYPVVVYLLKTSNITG